jgi:hypothetical protein
LTVDECQGFPRVYGDVLRDVLVALIFGFLIFWVVQLAVLDVVVAVVLMFV